MDFKSLCDPNEKTLYSVCLGVGIFVFVILTVTCLGLIYVGMILFYVYLFHIFFMCIIRGNGILITPEQFPRLNAIIDRLCEKLKLGYRPEAYLYEAGGIMNAMAAKLLGRKYMILYSDLVDACQSDDEMEMIVGHEIGHFKLGHLGISRYFILLANVFPMLYQAYSRACERSCDGLGLYACGELKAAQTALLHLAAGRKLSREVNLAAYRQQQDHLERDWLMVICRLFSTYPYLYERVLRLEGLYGTAQGIGRSS